jgi:hypothetical protein
LVLGSAGGRSSGLLGANGHSGELALGHGRLAFCRRFRRSCEGREGDHGRHEIGLAINQASKFFKHRQAHLANLAGRLLGFCGDNVDEFFEVHGMGSANDGRVDRGLHRAPSTTAALFCQFNPEELCWPCDRCRT